MTGHSDLMRSMRADTSKMVHTDEASQIKLLQYEIAGLRTMLANSTQLLAERDACISNYERCLRKILAETGNHSYPANTIETIAQLVRKTQQGERV